MPSLEELRRRYASAPSERVPEPEVTEGDARTGKAEHLVLKRINANQCAACGLGRVDAVGDACGRCGFEPSARPDDRLDLATLKRITSEAVEHESRTGTFARAFSYEEIDGGEDAVLKFGKYREWPVSRIAESKGGAEYLQWVRAQPACTGLLQGIIIHHLDALAVHRMSPSPPAHPSARCEPPTAKFGAKKKAAHLFEEPGPPFPEEDED